jgi:hypothetical protein
VASHARLFLVFRNAAVLTRSSPLRRPVQATVKVKENKEEDASARKKWGAGRHKIDKMEYSIWELEDLYGKIREEEGKIGREVRRACFTLCLLVSHALCRCCCDA